MAPGNHLDAFGSYYFGVEVEGMQTGYFRSVSGLKSEIEVVDLAEGGLNTRQHKLKGKMKFPNIVLKRGFVDGDLWTKHLKSHPEAGNESRFHGTIMQYGPGSGDGGTPTVVARWKFENGWVCKWEGPDFDASKNEISIESIEIAHEKLTFQKG